MNALWVLGLIGTIAFTLSRLGSLTPSGAAAATLVAWATFEGVGWNGIIPLATFFVTGTLLTKNTERLGRHPKGVKGSRRDWIQVVANGGILALGALLVPSAPVFGWAILAGAVSTAQADTWATEFGALNNLPPRMITSMKHVPRGTSGAVSSIGTMGGLAGAITAAIIFYVLPAPSFVPVAALAGGSAGMFFDSVLGATVERVYFCKTCRVQTVNKLHTCGEQAFLVRGFPMCTNDTVNLLSTAFGATVAIGVSLVLTI
ncbi:MAG: DUF92 domain-containing protein [Gemmatimonadota bacterium]|nr:DUF92 domain-containing protein [Gemmatimonadota bacterium]MDH5804117.1 DUF92 domain-containing protein [Gemmatimonadota bacterium]